MQVRINRQLEKFNEVSHRQGKRAWMNTIKTMPKVIKALCLLGFIMIIAMIGQLLLSSSLLNFSKKIADFIGGLLSVSKPLVQQNAYAIFVWVYYVFCAALYVFTLRAVHTIASRLWARKLSRVGLENSLFETPRLRSVKKHKNPKQARKGWLVYRFAPLGLSDDDFKKKSSRFSGVFHGQIGECSFTDNRKYIEVEVLPWKMVAPAVFKLFESHEQRENMVNMLGFASLIVGAPNGGKTYCMLTLAANYAAEGYTIIWLNRKGADVDEFRECANYYEADEVVAGWKTVFERLRRRERHEESEAEKQQKFLLVFDEYQSHVSRLGKEKTAFLQEFMSYIAMSRSLGFKTLIGSQAAYSEDMPKGARDMFSNIIAMGNLAKTQRAMYYEANIIEQLAPARQQGEGNIYHAADNSVEKVTVEPMADENAIMRQIADALNRPMLLSLSIEEDAQAKLLELI